MAADRAIDITSLASSLPAPPDEIAPYIFLKPREGQVFVDESRKRDNEVISYLAKIQRIRQNAKAARLQIVYTEYVNIEAERRTQKHDTQIESAMQSRARELFRKGARLGVSDIHLRILQDRTEVKARIHGLLQLWDDERMTVAQGKAIHRSIYQTMADQRAADTGLVEHKQQDGRISDPVMLGTEELHGIRIATSPTDRGAIMVLRLLHQTTGTISDDEDIFLTLGYETFQKEIIEDLMSLPEGIVILSGVTGSGKTTTIMNVLNTIDRREPGLHILTVEDPPEYNIACANQIPVTNVGDSASRNRGFAKTVRAMMRLDPDVVMVGEIRDFATAKASMDLSATGHNVWTTIHANGVFQTLTRLLEIRDDDTGQTLNPKLVLDSTMLIGIVSQRLIRTLCPHCSVGWSETIEQSMKPKAVERLRSLVSEYGADLSQLRFKGPGCDHPGCNQGIAGRTVAAEVGRMTQDLFKIFADNGTEAARTYWLNNGGFSQRAHAASKVLKGMVDFRDAESRVGPLEGEFLQNLELVYNPCRSDQGETETSEEIAETSA